MQSVKSLDPRVNRLPHAPDAIVPKAPLDQFGTFEVFVQPKEGKPFQHEGAVHAPDLELAYVLAKEAFTRRFTCTSLYVVDTRNVYISPTTDGDRNVYTLLDDIATTTGPQTSFEIYHLLKRGKQHLHAGTVEAATPAEAMQAAKEKLAGDKIVYNIWTIRTSDIRFTTPEEKDLWNTLPEKKFRDASDYKGGDKLKAFIGRSTS
ncbi:phenylacetic acid degradation b [Ohtaekwangia sp.]|uniref:phenylacetic acid degradation b n=1 Tax=Ohtaekwangia sp. TaxID=2066019 RepID=UPI0039C9C180